MEASEAMFSSPIDERTLNYVKADYWGECSTLKCGYVPCIAADDLAD